MGKSPSWTLQSDHVESYAYIPTFSKEECEQIIKLLSDKEELGPGKVNNHGLYVPNEEVRISDVAFIQPEEENHWIYRRLTDSVLRLNEQYFKFDLHGFNEGLQFTRYEAPGGKYDWHVDRMFNGVIRKLSIVVQLTDPEEYTGGDFEIMISPKEQQLPREQGMMLAFPSYTLHRVSPMQTGVRHSLVGWIAGKPFV